MSASQFPIFSVSVDRHVRWHQLEWRQPVYILLPGAALCTQLQGAPMDCCGVSADPLPTPHPPPPVQASNLSEVRVVVGGAPFLTGGNSSQKGAGIPSELDCSQVVQQKDPPPPSGVKKLF